MSTKQRYATRIVVYLAVRSEDGPVRKGDIARSENIPADYVEQLCIKLKAAGLIRSHRGQRGGFSLARSSSEISVADVFLALDGAVPMVDCLEAPCPRSPICVTQAVWRRADQALRNVLGEARIDKLAREAKSRGAGALSFDI